MQELSSEAYAPDGTVWWQLEKWPGTNLPFGDEAKIAAWLASTRFIGELFTTDDLRVALGDGLERNGREHLQRRLRELRDRDKWRIPSKKYERTIPVGHYRLDFIGWHPGVGPRPKKLNTISAKTRRIVIERDGRRCQICNIGAGEPYPENPAKTAVMTVGHVTPSSYEGSASISNLQAECSFCNETMRSDTGRPESIEEMRGAIRDLNRKDLEKVQNWAEVGHRTQDKADTTYDRIRMLSPGDRDKIVVELATMIGR
jgi:hypothetical protein